MASYKVDEFVDGFRISAEPLAFDTPGADPWFVDFCYEFTGGRRQPVTVIRRQHYFEILETSARIPLPEYRSLVQGCSEVLMSSWVCADLSQLFKDMVDEEMHSGWSEYCVEKWALERTRRGIGKRLHSQWTRLVSSADPDILKVQRHAFSAAFGSLAGPGFGSVDRPLICSPELYEDRTIVNDLKRYRPAAMLTYHCGMTLDRLRNWRTVFCPRDVKPYHALNVTLDNFPGGVPWRALRRLRGIRLPRPIRHRSELLVTLDADTGRPNWSVFAHARHSEIKEAFTTFAREANYQNSLSFRVLRDSWGG